MMKFKKTFFVVSVLSAISYAGEKINARHEAMELKCGITTRDLKTAVTTVLLPPVLKTITQEHDFEFKTTFSDAKQKVWNIQLLGSAPSITDREIGLAWSIRDSSGAPSDIEKVTTSIPIESGQRASLNVNWNGVVVKARCELKTGP